MERAFQHFKKYLREKNLKLTKQREAIAKMFLAKEGHYCVDELYYALRRKYSYIGYTTVYRTLKLFKTARMASEVNFTGKRKRFEHLFERPHHDHFFCVGCGSVIEFVDPEIEEKQEVLCRRFDFKGQKHLMQIFGLCKDCQRGGENPQW